MIKRMTSGSHPKLEILGEDQLHEIHLATLRILEKTGVVLHDEDAVKLLKEAGAYVRGDRVRISNNLVETALKSAPSRIELGVANREQNCLLERNITNFGLGTDLPEFIDPLSEQVRPTSLNDIENTGRLAEWCEHIDFIACNGLAQDVPVHLADLYHYKALRTYSKKPILTTAKDYYNMKALIDMAAVEAGGYEELKQSPSIVLYAEPISPLVNSKEALQKLMLCAEYCIPVTYSSGVMAGATGPATLIGSLVLGNAEGLAGLAIHQLKKRGAPFIYGIVSSVMDMRTAISAYGGPELPMMNAIVGELGRFYNLPSFGTAGCTDSCCLDVQLGMEYMYSIMLASLGGTNLTHDIGYMGSGMIGSLESFLVANEIIEFVSHLMKGAQMSLETLATSLIDKVGPGGNFLLEPHTHNHFKRESWHPNFLNRSQYPIWNKQGDRSFENKVRQKVRDLLQNYWPSRIEETNEIALTEIIRENEKRIKTSQAR